MATLEELTARVAISELKARYFRAVDMKDWETFEALFEENATLAAVDDQPGVVFRGRAAIRAGVAASLETAATVHRGHMPEIWFDNPDQAQGIWSMEDELFFTEDSSSPFARWLRPLSRALPPDGRPMAVPERRVAPTSRRNATTLRRRRRR